MLYEYLLNLEGTLAVDFEATQALLEEKAIKYMQPGWPFLSLLRIKINLFLIKVRMFQQFNSDSDFFQSMLYFFYIEVLIVVTPSKCISLN